MDDLRRPTHLLFDFFGTLVDYSPSRTEQGYPRSHALLRGFGSTLDYDGFLAAWSAVSARFDRETAADEREFSMDELTAAFLTETLPAAPTEGQVAGFVAAYLAEWGAAIRPVEGVAELLRTLAGQYRLAVVSNTHSPTMVPALLDDLGVLDLMDAVVLSVDTGHRKPHPSIYRATLERLGLSPADAWFIGDSAAPDYHGPRRTGIPALLITPADAAGTADTAPDVPPAHRIPSVHALPGLLAAVS
ncbi:MULTISPECIES: HAD family hydrolase [Kitasatospora]|uniref:Putative hydrolase n=1 Tax=Kitasatospora setae (strain ATCC 33774 / DSM 43861 / JCM 3304 / KCC A-0304 / NBRC 14216 / KM-6054) TaxID=452652 RepID=E4NIY6_KITSK|nr:MULTISPECIES: HAD family hydrolase [Kitasatospora]BAJ32934.1 putative hydrolase [Kitasatospora setae KM-6054]